MIRLANSAGHLWLAWFVWLRAVIAMAAVARVAVTGARLGSNGHESP